MEALGRRHLEGRWSIADPFKSLTSALAGAGSKITSAAGAAATAIQQGEPRFIHICYHLLMRMAVNRHHRQRGQVRRHLFQQQYWLDQPA